MLSIFKTDGNAAYELEVYKTKDVFRPQEVQKAQPGDPLGSPTVGSFETKTSELVLVNLHLSLVWRLSLFLKRLGEGLYCEAHSLMTTHLKWLLEGGAWLEEMDLAV